MNDPQVVALIYRVEHGDSVSYENAGPLRNFSQTPEFDLTVEDKIARFEFAKGYENEDEDEALKAIEPFIQQWEFETGIRWGPNSFKLRYTNAEIIDRNASPPKSGTRKLRPAGHVLGNFTAEAKIMLGHAHYPPPPSGGSVDPDDPYVVMMRRRYEQYRLGRAKQPEMAYFCVTVLEKKYGDLSAAAKECGISRNVLKEIKKLSSNKGGEDSRKAGGFDDEFTRQEKRFLNRALKEIIIRAAQVAADDSQCLPQITMADLPKL